MPRTPLCLLCALMIAGCSDDTTDTDDDGSGSGSGGDGGAAQGAGGGGGQASSSTAGGGGSPVDRCPEVCDEMDALFTSFGCTLEECNCKAPCADLLEASLDCISARSECTCSGNELECDGACADETNAANQCWQDN